MNKSGSSIGAVILGFILWKYVGLHILVAAVISFAAWPLFAGIFSGIGSLFAGKGPTLHRLNDETDVKGMFVALSFLQNDFPALSDDAFKSFMKKTFFIALNAAKAETGDARLFTVAEGALPVCIYYNVLKSYSETNMRSWGSACGSLMKDNDIDADNLIVAYFKYSLPDTNEEKQGCVMVAFSKSIPVAENAGEDAETIKRKILPEFNIGGF
ncbi:MAG: hypothetical protein LBD27_07770 [Tannerella sp.]|jgi:hypothetical protein|nr:hypothetical protein [Tannerella sp.]